jgi:hypothetical protein
MDLVLVMLGTAYSVANHQQCCISYNKLDVVSWLVAYLLVHWYVTSCFPLCALVVVVSCSVCFIIHCLSSSALLHNSFFPSVIVCPIVYLDPIVVSCSDVAVFPIAIFLVAVSWCAVAAEHQELFCIITKQTNKQMDFLSWYVSVSELQVAE